MTISEQIKADLARRLGSTDALPCKLTLDALARHYGASLTPVRRAVEDLVALGAIERLDNGRLKPGVVKVSDLENLSAEADAVPGRDELEQAVRLEVVRRSLRRDSEFLREQATAEQVGAGRTAVRQVFSRLAGAGMLEHVPRRGWRVKPYSEADMLDFLVVREMLELKALDLARPRLERARLAALLDANQPDRHKIPRLNDELHDYWITQCGNYYIQDFFNRFSVFYSTLFNSAVTDNATRSYMAHEHCNILQALLDEDWRAARRALSHHIADQKPAVARMIETIAG